MSEIRKNIAVIICFYGKFPWYFKLFLHTCRHNPTIDFFIFSDQPSVHNQPANVQIINLSLASLKSLIEFKIGFNVKINHSYKLTDFKPAYGFIFEEVIREYDFWAHGDLDVVYGDIRSFLTEDVLQNDVISVRHDHLAGVFTLFRNNFENNRLFTRSRDYKRVMKTSVHCCFDETNFDYQAFRNQSKQSPPIRDIESMSHLVLRLSCEENLRVYFDLHILEGLFDEVVWSKGKVIYQQRFEVLLYHLLMLKQSLTMSDLPEVFPDTIKFSTSDITI